MPTNVEGPDALCDTSVAVALVVADHQYHEHTAEVLRGRRLGLCGLAVFETFSVLTRLPPPIRRPPGIVRDILDRTFPHSRFLSSDAAGVLLERLGTAGVAGGAVYDALVAATAIEHGVPLVSRDGRAADTYRLLGCPLELISDGH